MSKNTKTVKMSNSSKPKPSTGNTLPRNRTKVLRQISSSITDNIAIFDNQCPAVFLVTRDLTVDIFNTLVSLSGD